MEELTKHINFYDPSFCIAAITIFFNPLFWNVVRHLQLFCDHSSVDGAVFLYNPTQFSVFHWN